jgi:hypothetical protein
MFFGALKIKMRLHNDFSLFLNPNQSNYETDQTTYTLSLFYLILDGGTSILDIIFQFQD